MINNNNISKYFAYFFFSIFFFIGILTFKDYGISVDEEYQRIAGFYWLNYLLSFTSFEDLKSISAFKFDQIVDFTLPHPKDHIYYGIIFDLPMAFFEVIFKIEDSKDYFHFRHLSNFLLFFIASIFFYKLLLNRFLSYNISLIGVLFFILSPRIYGSSFFNNKDVVFLSLATIAIFYCFKVFDKTSYKNLLLFALFAGLSTSHRILGIFLPISFLVFYLLSILSNNKDLNKLPSIVFFLFFYFFFSTLFWPVLWKDPFENFILAFKYFSDHPLKIGMLFDGQYIKTTLLPFNYIFKWIFISTPILYSFLFIVGYSQILKKFFLKFINIKDTPSKYDLWKDNNEKKDLFILFNITCVISYLVFFNVILYNGWRHTYFINIFIIYIAVYAFYQINISFKKQYFKKVQFGLVLIYLIFILNKMLIYHPYQNIYFNSLYNDLSIHKKFEVDYWGLTGKKFFNDILILNPDKSQIKIGTASFLPLHRSIKLLDKRKRGKIQIIGQDFQNADYLYSNFISEVDKNSDDKYKIPDNFTKIDEFILDNVKIYQVFKKNY